MSNDLGEKGPALDRAGSQNTVIGRDKTRVLNTLGRVGRGAAGGLMIGAAAFGIYNVMDSDAEHNREITSHLNNKIDFKTGSDAEPSDDMANMFDDGMDALAIGGGVVLGGLGARQVRRAISTKEQARSELAIDGRPGGYIRKTVAVGAVATLGATIFGVSHDVGRAVGKAQISALEAIVNEDDFPRDMTMLSKSGSPELATTPSVPSETMAKLFEAKERLDIEGVDIVPIYYSWESAIREKDKDHGSDKKILTVVMGLPSDVTGLPETKENKCDATPINAAPVLGDIGDKLTLAGDTYVIKGHLDGSGPNTVPIAMNFEDYAKCFTGNQDQPFNLVALRGDKQKVKELIDEAGVVQKDGMRESTIQQFFDETERTSKNNSNGLVLTFLAISAIASGAALGYKAKSDMANNRDINSMLLAQGVPRRSIKRIADIKSDREALWSSVASMPLITAADYSTVISTPGAVEVSPSATTFLVVLAATTGIGRLANAAVGPVEMHKLNPTKRGA